jgi:hypothetical protein
MDKISSNKPWLSFVMWRYIPVVESFAEILAPEPGLLIARMGVFIQGDYKKIK